MCINPFNNFIVRLKKILLNFSHNKLGKKTKSFNKSKHPTKIEYDGHEFLFEGYSIFSHEQIENIPECVVVIYNHEYKLSIVKEEMIEVCF